MRTLPDVFGQVNHNVPEGCFQVIHPAAIVNRELLLAEGWEFQLGLRLGTVNKEPPPFMATEADSMTLSRMLQTAPEVACRAST